MQVGAVALWWGPAYAALPYLARIDQSVIGLFGVQVYPERENDR
jgi:hypothetical protein